MPPGRARRSPSSTSWRATWSCATRRGSTPTTPTTARPRWARRCPTRDPNQTITIVDQLDQGVRSLEIDAHLFNSPQDPRVGPRGPIVCHARGEEQGHAGCTTEKPLVVVLREITGVAEPPPRPGAAALPGVPPRVARRATTRAPTRSTRPSAGSSTAPRAAARAATRCRSKLTRDQVRAAGKRVVLMGPCGEGSALAGLRARRGASARPARTTPRSATSRAAAPTSRAGSTTRQVIRYYEDATQLSRAR